LTVSLFADKKRETSGSKLDRFRGGRESVAAPKNMIVGIGLLGSGTVGQAIQEIVFGGAGKKEPGLELRIVKIYTRRPEKKKWYASQARLFTTDPAEVIDHPDADIIVEALGAHEERDLSVFKDHIVRALSNGKSVVTSNKAVLARYGEEIWLAAAEHGQQLRFEACVGGGIPIIRSLTQSFAAEIPEAIYGIINGTSNYVLSEMSGSGKSYAQALSDAKRRGYAETNPTSDVTGLDAEAKLVLLTAVTFGLHIKPGVIWRRGIEDIHPVDFLYAARKGRATIKPLAVARSDAGSVQAFVAPALVPDNHFLSTVDGPTNAIFFKGRRSAERDGSDSGVSKDWNYAFVGPGAGGGPTAVAVMGDVWELARGGKSRCAGLASLAPPAAYSVQSQERISACFYVRFVVKDRAGIVGEICQVFGHAGINVSEIWQLSHTDQERESLIHSYRLGSKPQEILPFVITLERTTVGQLTNALGSVRSKDFILVEPVWLPIWDVG
jgi:homoserine dehydrogenase